MKLLVIGHSVLDIIHKDKNQEIKPGGIYYTLNALNKISSEDELFVCTSMEENLNSYFKEAFFNWNVEFVNNSEIPKVNLYINPGQERCEQYTNLNTPLTLPTSSLNIFDAILINMITGFDITLDSLREIRKNFKGPIYMDVHTLSRGVDDKMQRYFRPIENFFDWKENLNIIQVNEHEIFTISNEKDEISIAKDILLNSRSGLPQQLILTKGELGARVYYKKGNEIASYYKSASKIDVFNTIGLGDTFGAVYFYSYFKRNSFYNSLDLAVNAGGFAASNEGFHQLTKIKNVLF